MAQEQEQTERSKVIDIGEWKKAHGLPSPPYQPTNETTTVFVNKFSNPSFWTVPPKRPSQ
jgi:hypothetical protein